MIFVMIPPDDRVFRHVIEDQGRQHHPRISVVSHSRAGNSATHTSGWCGSGKSFQSPNES